MKFLQKHSDSEILKQNLSYNNTSQRKLIRAYLVDEQKGFCAYTEKYLNKTESIDIEHFDSRLKGKNEDNYWNWYACVHWLNMRKKPLDKRFLPILTPFDNSVSERIIYFQGIFVAKNKGDVEAENLIKFLLFNDCHVVEERIKHVKEIVRFREMWGNDELFIQFLKENKKYLSFITSLENELNISLSNLLQ